MPTGPEAIDDALLDRLYSIIPELLKSFARRIGYMSESRESRVVMVFVSKCRQ